MSEHLVPCRDCEDLSIEDRAACEWCGGFGAVPCANPFCDECGFPEVESGSDSEPRHAG